MIQAIVKVGKSSDAKFNNVQAYRAITYREVEVMLSKNDNISFIVFEEVKDSDASRIRNILKSFNVLGVIYNRAMPINEAIEEIGIQTVGNLKDLQLYIESQLGINITTFRREVEPVDEDQYNTEETTEEFTGNDEIEKNDTDISDIDTVEISESAEDENEEESKEVDNIQNELAEALEATTTNFDINVTKEEEVVQNADIMSKEDIMDSEDDFEAIFSTLDDSDTAAVSTLQDLEKQKNFERELESINKQLNYALDNVRNLSELKVHLEDELNQYKEFVKRIKTSTEVIEVTADTVDKRQLEQQVKQLEGLVDTLKLEADEANKLRETIDSLQNELQNQSVSIEELQKQLENATNNEEVDKLRKRASLEAHSRIFVTQALISINNELVNTQSALTKKMHEVGALLTEYKKLEVKIQELQAEKEALIEEKQSSEVSMTEQIRVLTERVNETDMQLSEANQQLIIRNAEVTESKAEIERLRSELQTTRNTLDITKKALEDQSNEVMRFQEMGAEELHENMQALAESNSTLAIEIGRLRRDKDELQRQVDAKARENNELSEQIKTLNIRAKALSRTADAGETIKMSCTYSGKAFILPVFGSGSFGISTTAVSLANALDGNVLVMDLDIVNPKLDGWFGKNPLNKSLPDIDNEMKKTAFGALVEKGTGYVLDHKTDIVTTVVQSKNGDRRIDYFSGAYTKLNMFKLMAVDFSELITYLGHEYDYIVADLGRIGGSEITNAMIRMFNEISFKNIIVGLHDGGDTRTLALKIQAERIDRSKSIWVLNLAKSDKLDDLMKKSISTSKHIVFGRDMKIYGEKIPYNKVGILKDRLSKLVELILQ